MDGDRIMVYKLFIEDGEYVDVNTDEPRNLLETTIAISPEGVNVGWAEFDNIEQAMEYFNIRKKL
jgi:hypothetical protein